MKNSRNKKEKIIKKIFYFIVCCENEEKKIKFFKKYIQPFLGILKKNAMEKQNNRNKK